MSITVRQFSAQVKDPSTGNMIPAGLLSSDALGAIDTAKNTAVAAVQAQGATTIASIPSDYTSLSNEVDDLKNALNENTKSLGNSLYNQFTKPVNTSASGWRLKTDGLCEAYTGYKLDKYTVIAGSKVKIKSDDQFQFQTVAGVPASGLNNRVGSTYGKGVYFLTVPVGATYLIVSTPTSSESAVYVIDSAFEAVNGYSVIPDLTGKIVPEKYIYGSTGEEAVSAYYNCTDFIELSDYVPGSKLQCRCTLSGNAGIAFYDETKTTPLYAVSGTTAGDKGYSTGTEIRYFAIPENAKYFRASLNIDEGGATKDDFAIMYLCLPGIAETEAIAASTKSDVDAMKETSPVSVNATADSYKIASSGLAVADSNYNIKKYLVNAGTEIVVTSDDHFQFQDTSNVSTQNTDHVVGQTYGAGKFTLTVPNGATYLVVSTPKTGSTALVEIFVGYIFATKATANGEGQAYTDLVQGTFNTIGTYIASNARIRTSGEIAVKAWDSVHVNPGSLEWYYCIWESSVGADHVVEYKGFETGELTLVFKQDGYFALAFKATNGSDITPSDFDGTITLYNSQIDRNKNRLDNIADEGGTVPDYYFADSYLDNKINRINALASGCMGNGDAFIFITDEHWTDNAKKSPALIKYISEKTHVTMLVSGGDTGDGVSFDFVNKVNEAFKGRIYHLAGNHEYFPVTSLGGNDIAYAFNNNYVYELKGDPRKPYYYVDNNYKKIRYVMLNAFIRNGTGDIGTDIVNDYDPTWSDQCTWFSTVALNVPTDWDVIVFSHYIGRTNLPIGEDNGLDGARPIYTAIDTFNADANRTGQVIAVVQGHNHIDTIYHTTGVGEGTPIIETTCDKYRETGNEPWMTEYRIPGTITEQAFDVMIVDREQKIITAVRIGCKAMDNEDIHHTAPTFDPVPRLEERVIDYSLTLS